MVRTRNNSDTTIGVKGDQTSAKSGPVKMPKQLYEIGEMYYVREYNGVISIMIKGVVQYDDQPVYEIAYQGLKMDNGFIQQSDAIEHFLPFTEQLEQQYRDFLKQRGGSYSNYTIRRQRSESLKSKMRGVQFSPGSEPQPEDTSNTPRKRMKNSTKKGPRSKKSRSTNTVEEVEDAFEDAQEMSFETAQVEVPTIQANEPESQANRTMDTTASVQAEVPTIKADEPESQANRTMDTTASVQAEVPTIKAYEPESQAERTTDTTTSVQAGVPIIQANEPEARIPASELKSEIDSALKAKPEGIRSIPTDEQINRAQETNKEKATDKASMMGDHTQEMTIANPPVRAELSTIQANEPEARVPASELKSEIDRALKAESEAIRSIPTDEQINRVPETNKDKATDKASIVAAMLDSMFGF